MTALYVSLAGGLGASVRFMVDSVVRAFTGRNFPFGTLIINVSGSFILGILTGLVLHHHASVDTKLIVGTGFCGGFTTFSTASFEAVRLIEERRMTALSIQVIGNAALALSAAALGIWIA